MPPQTLPRTLERIAQDAELPLPSSRQVQQRHMR